MRDPWTAIGWLIAAILVLVFIALAFEAVGPID